MTMAALDKILATAKNKSDAIKQRAKTVKPKDGQNRIVLLLGWRKGQEEVFFHDFGQHYIKNTAGELQAVYPCLDKTFNKPCPVCQAIGQAATGVTDDEQIKALKDANSGQSYLLNVLTLDGENKTEPQILEIRKSVFGQILDLMEDWGGAVFDMDEPQIIVINREGKGLNTKYSVQISAKKHPMNGADVYSKLNDLDEYVRQENEENMQRAIGAVKGVVGLLPTSSDTKAIGTSAEAIEVHETSRAAEASRSTASEIQLDSELDDLLGGLDDTAA